MRPSRQSFPRSQPEWIGIGQTLKLLCLQWRYGTGLIEPDVFVELAWQNGLESNDFEAQSRVGRSPRWLVRAGVASNPRQVSGTNSRKGSRNRGSPVSWHSRS